MSNIRLKGLNLDERLTIDQARKLVLHSQWLPRVKRTGTARDATLSAIEHLGYVQIDTISAVQRAHHHTLWNRNPRYQRSHLDQLVADKQVYEYWSHAASFLPMRDFRHSLVMKKRITEGDQQHWYVRDERMMNAVLRRIEVEGPLMAKDFENSRTITTKKPNAKKPGAWNSKPAKRALETLFMMGELMIAGRTGFHKVYDLTHRVLPSNVDTRIPTLKEHARFLIERFLKSNGLGQPAEISYLLKNIKPFVLDAIEDMIANGEVQRIVVDQRPYFVLPGSLSLLNKPLARSQLRILSPFDNLLIQRKRMQALFEFDYLIECYVPESKRQYGYFSLPILWDGRLVARMDCKADRKESVLHIHHMAMETGLGDHESFMRSLQKELVVFAKFNDCRELRLHRTTPVKWKRTLNELLKNTEI